MLLVQSQNVMVQPILLLFIVLMIERNMLKYTRDTHFSTPLLKNQGIRAEHTHLYPPSFQKSSTITFAKDSLEIFFS